VCAVGFYSDGVHYEHSADFALKLMDMKLLLELQSVDGQGSGVNKAVLRAKSHLVGRPQFAHSITLPECWLPSAAVRGDL
jgi:hypothetical protein